MSDKTKKILIGILTGFIAFIFIGSAFSKFFADANAIKAAANWGLPEQTFLLLGAVELAILILFLLPRTGILGTLLLAAYMGGAIATHLEHQESILAPCIVQGFVWIVAALRFPELRKRLLQSESK